MKISIITPVFNGEKTIKTCIESVSSQSYSDYEHIIMDGGSTDSTIDIIKAYNSPKIVLYSQKDKGSCDALNKGIGNAKGDFVCFLCADDFYCDNSVLQKISNEVKKDSGLDLIYSDIVYVKREETDKVVRSWKSRKFTKGLYLSGWLPPHTSLFIRTIRLKQFGTFNLEYKLAADYDLSYRLFETHALKSKYIPEIFVKMRMGGMSNSNYRAMYESLKECYLILKKNKVNYPLIPVILSFFYRFKQLLH
jgi:glycosyltransferase involved in cell wall biosynthesis